ncbi:hypothetical protein Acr_10g0004190 [Actinidia rufa]|uniref:Uncharacterized protein n=1 Tax=Actinidia rufa TaxID=165716 RepID=A0A7J0F8J5_9ERIC|nr:hypothetical protein Acr_10g0004190 [Actinidia rufa]
MQLFNPEGGDGALSPYLHAAKEPDTPYLKGNHYLYLKNPCQPQTRLVTDNLDKDLFIDEFVWVLGKASIQIRARARLTWEDSRPWARSKSASAIDPPAIVAPPISQVPLPSPDLVPALSTRAKVKLSSSEALLQCNGRELVVGLSKKSRKKIGARLELAPTMQERDASNEVVSEAWGMVGIPNKSPGVVGELGQEITKIEEDGAILVEDGVVVVEDGVPAEGTSHNLSSDL